MSFQSILLLVFAILFVVYLCVDLFVLFKRPHRPTLRESLLQSGFWIGCALIFAGLIAWQSQADAALFLSAYITEKTLSFDNLFVILLIFTYFDIDEKYQHKVLFWGILGAVVLRGIFILLGAQIVEQFHWILYIFGMFLVWSGYKILTQKTEQDEDIGKSRILRLMKRYIPLTTAHHGGRFWLRENGKSVATTLFLALLMVEFSDVLFAVDSIPAVFAITSSPFIVFTSNMFAIMGLRSLYFVIEHFLKKFYLLSKGLALVLIFIGAKVFSPLVGMHISPGVSLAVLATILITSMVLSVYIPKKS
jgi:tellurite resistance protein TerC